MRGAEAGSVLVAFARAFAEDTGMASTSTAAAAATLSPEMLVEPLTTKTAEAGMSNTVAQSLIAMQRPRNQCTSSRR